MRSVLLFLGCPIWPLDVQSDLVWVELVNKDALACELNRALASMNNLVILSLDAVAEDWRVVADCLCDTAEVGSDHFVSFA